MSQADNMRMTAEIVDGFTGPLTRLRNMIRGVNDGSGVTKLQAGLDGATKSTATLAREVGSTLSPALAAVGVAGLSVAGAMAMASSAVRNFTGTGSTLALMSRETGMATEAMRTLMEVGRRFDIAPEAMQQSFRAFSENAQQLRKGIGDVTGFLMSQSPAVAKWASDLQSDLAKGLDPDVAYRRSLEFMRRIQDPIQRGQFAEKIFGNKSIGVMGSEDIGKIIDDTAKKLGALPKAFAENALAFKHSWDDITTSLTGLRDAVGVEVIKPLKEMTDAFATFVQRPEVREDFVKTMKEISDTLKNTEWRSVGSGIATMFGVIGTAALDTATAIKTVSDVFKAVKEGRIVDALKTLDSPSTAPFTPPVSIPSIPRMLGFQNTPVEKLEKQRDGVQAQVDRMDEITAARRKLSAGAAGEDDQVKQQRDKLTNEIRELTDEIKKLREAATNGATVQQQSFDGNNPLANLIQKASVTSGMWPATPAGSGGGGGRFPNMRGLAGGGGGPGSGAGRGPLGAPDGTGGSRSWRNNNPGNLEWGEFAKSMGATHSDGRFATFPDYATGRKAQEKLLFDSKNYRNLTLGQAISRWAPGAENNVPNYIKAMGAHDPNKPMSEYTPDERGKLLDAMQKHEGWREGSRNKPIDIGNLRVKDGARGQAFGGGRTHQGTLDAAKAIQSLGGIERFTGFNDFHHARSGRGMHPHGLAGDFTINDRRQSAAMAEKVRDMFRGAGLKDGRDFHVRDEYLHPSRGATGPHMHYEFRSPAAAKAFQEFREAQKKAAEARAEASDGRASEGGKRFNSERESYLAAPTFKDRMPKLMNSDDLLRKALKSPIMQQQSSVDLKGGANLEVHFKNAPPGMSTSTSTTGILKDLKVRQGVKLPTAGVDI